jgi:hypothetical protein
MTKMLKQFDSARREFRYCFQKSAVTCGPAACLIMWANVHQAVPIADEGGVIALTKLFPDPWDPVKGANLTNLASVLRNMAVPVKEERHDTVDAMRRSLVGKVKPKKPAMVFMRWRSTASTIGHFLVVGHAANDHCTFLDPQYGLQEMTNPPYRPASDEDPPPELRFTGAVLVMD